VAADLRRHPGRSLVLAGEAQPPAVHALCHFLNGRLGSFGKTVHFHKVAYREEGIPSLRRLAADAAAGRVHGVLFLGTNPVYDTPPDLGLASAFEKLQYRAHLGRYVDETASRCEWHVPEAHPLESWGDTASHDGTQALQQPLIAPLFGGKSSLEVTGVLLDPGKTGYDLVRAYWASRYPEIDFEKRWRRWLHDGLVAEAKLPTRPPSPPRAAAPVADVPPATGGLELDIRPDPAVWDGEFSNNAWLQEMPRPFTKLVWENCAVLSPPTAARFGVHDRSLVEIAVGSTSLQVPVLLVDTQPDDTVTVTLGYGRSFGRIAKGRGFDAYRFRTSESPWTRSAVKLRAVGKSASLVTTQGHNTMEGRDIVRSGDIEAYRRDSHFLDRHPFPGRIFEPSLRPAPQSYPPFPNSGENYQWGMSIDLGTCIGCQACVLACQSENNIPVVGREEVERGRLMHWLRVDNYFGANAGQPSRVHFMPVPCMHCETAPCELVCPVGATLHGHEGLNEMVYNRCVGTRYCSNNCPYKVRRFNFFNYRDPAPLIRLMQNPDVTVRERGVMEKCTYCVQRINRARIAADKENRLIREGELTTACAQACPTRAIVFGNTADPKSEVSRRKSRPLNYSLLEDLNTKPRTTYLAKLWNAGTEPAAGEKGVKP
jgi:molybdopterin-containing oxidoreductase family iron-sulfur binding subunit